MELLIFLLSANYSRVLMFGLYRRSLDKIQQINLCIMENFWSSICGPHDACLLLFYYA
jgi:hypothetical protein